MKYGFVLPSGDARAVANAAREAEQAGWDGFFVWEPVWGVDAWVALTAAAMVTERIRLGTMLSPVSRMRPWKLASETATLDNLSGGRVLLSVGLGAVDTGFEAFGEETDRKKRAELLDEGLEIVTGLWGGQPFKFEGKHYHVNETEFSLPAPPVQQPRIPIWVVGAWPRMKSMRRVLRYDGLIPTVVGGEASQGTPGDLRAAVSYVMANRQADTPFDFVVEGTTPGGDAASQREQVEPWAEAGATWWMEALWQSEGLDPVLQRLREGPPRLGL